MFIHVVDARHLGGHRLWLRFSDGAQGEIDLADELDGEVFEPLRDPARFARFEVDRTICWENGADLAPEFLRERLRAAEASARASP